MASEKIALVLSGGGMKTSYIAGVISTLVKDKNLPTFDMVIGGSGASSIAAFYVSKQYENLEKAWDLLATKKFISPLRFWNVVDIEHLTHFVLSEKLPLNLDALRSSPVEFLIAAMNATSEKIEYFSNHSSVDILTAIKATHSIPFLAKPVTINGEKYCDSFETSFPWFHIQEALSRGATRVVVVSCLKDTPTLPVLRLEKLIFQSLNRSFGKKHTLYHKKMLEDSQFFKQQKNILYISPSASIRCGDFTTDYTVLKNTFDLGQHDASIMKVAEFLK